MNKIPLIITFAVASSLAFGQSASIKRELAQQMLKNGDINSSCIREQGGGVKAISITLAFLDMDKQPEYIVTGDGSCCVGARRCSTWIYQKMGQSYRKIYGGVDGDQADIQVLKATTKGYKNLRSTVYSGNESFSAIFKWNGSTYR